ncbi:MAG: 3-methyl-2-oxobutanoate hydroxymethyltransferase [Duodenibacillus sp.]|nr:3-methyl-2-oxobutanoate hydroxymethyltransferase [Duodenibacillus sp.]
MKHTVATLQAAKARGERFAMVTCYDYTTAGIVEDAGIETVLVGDSLGNVMLGYENTLRVTMEDMIHHSRAVSRGLKDALLVVDMPFMSYQASCEDAVRNAGRLVQEGFAEVVKLEGGVKVADRIAAIVDAGIPVCAHIGMTPQSVNSFGGFKVQGKSLETAQRFLDDARAVEQAGASMVVFECVPALLAERASRMLKIPTVGIGAGAATDAQVLVCQDLLGMYRDFTPKFVKRFAETGSQMKRAFEEYAREVRAGTFPAAEHEYGMAQDVLERLR